MPRRHVVVTLFGAALLIVLAVLLQAAVGLNHDVAWYVYVARSVAQGVPYYVDRAGSYLDVNPPLVVWALIPPLWLADRLHLSLTAAPILLVVVEAIAGIGLSAALVRKVRAAWALPWSVAFAGLLLVGHEFAQREHQVVLLLAPALVGLALGSAERAAPRWLRVSVGLAAGLGVAFKPHFAFAWALVELVVALSDRRPRQLVRLEVLVAVAVVITYGTAVMVFTPEYLTLARTWGPLYLRYLRTSMGVLIFQGECIASALTLVAVARLRTGGAEGRTAFVFGVASASFAAAAVLQEKGFSYHWYPAIAFATISIVGGVRALGDERPGWTRVGAVLFASVLVIIVVSERLRYSVALARDYRRLASAFAATAGEASTPTGEALVILTTRLPDAFPMVTVLGYPWLQRWPSLWPLEAHGPIDCRAPGAGADRLHEQRTRDGLWEDLVRVKPDIIIVQPVPQAASRRPGCQTLADHLAREPRFATMFSEYQMWGRIRNGTSAPFIVLRRRPTAERNHQLEQIL